MENTKLQIIDNSCQTEEKTCSCCATDFFEEKSPHWRRNQFLKGAAAGSLLAVGLFLEHLTSYSVIAQILFISVIAVSGRDILKKAWYSLRKRRLDMNCLISIAAFGAFLVGSGEEGAAVVFLFFIAETLEDSAAARAKRSIGDLLHLAPETAKVKRGSREIELHTPEIETGDVIVIRPGEKIPLDGRVIQGQSSVNEAPITGESLPAEKAPGDGVYAGTMNESGYLEIEVLNKSETTLLSRIVKLVEEAERKKSETEKFIDKFARIYTPVVIGLAFATFIVPVVLMGHPWDVWLYRALVLLVVSCPCALAISTPIAMVSAITSATKQGVLIKGATFIEELNKIKAFAFDKTGTLTKGKLEITDIISFNGYSGADVLSIAASLEARSEHPIARAITKRAVNEKIEISEVSNFRSIQGKGLEAVIKEKKYHAGARNLFDELSTEADSALTQLERDGKTSIIISENNSLIGVIALADKVRDTAPHVISDLKKMNIRTEMLTGDNERVARSLAQQTQVDDYFAGLLPEDKVTVVERLRQKFKNVAMVGDGVNDAPALAAANVGIAMGTAGTDVAIETADIALMHDDLSRIGYLIHLSRKTMGVVKQNVSVSLLVKGSFTVLAVTGFINLWVAVAVGDMGLSLAVIFNALRLTRVKA
jgi:Cd2+/Zn2+-exporting ATPase